MLIVIATGAAGAGQQLQEWPWEFHAILAACTMVINLWAYWIEYRCVQMNAKVISDVLDEVDRIRAERGLSTNAEALESQRQS